MQENKLINEVFFNFKLKIKQTIKEPEGKSTKRQRV